MSSLVFAALTPARILLTISTLLWKNKGIYTFKDYEKLVRGKYISPELLKAIEISKYAIIVLSRNYVFSRWCLIELAKIVECIEETKLTVLPIFYHVDPSHVRNQTGTLAEAFEKHEKDPKVKQRGCASM